MKRDDFMVVGGKSPRRNLTPSVRALILLGALSYAENSDTVALAKLMGVSTRTIKRACSALESERVVVATRRGSAPTVWTLDKNRIDGHQRIQLQAMLLAWLAAQHVGKIDHMQVWDRLKGRAYHYAKTDEHTSPRVLGTMIADEVKTYVHQREQDISDFFRQLRAYGEPEATNG